MVPYGDRQQPAVVFRCSSCDAQHIERFPAGKAAPDQAAKRSRRLGWVVDPDRTGANRCPTCTLARRASAAGDKPQKELPQVSARPSLLPLPPAPAAPTAPAPPLLLREPTHQDRMRIRNAMDTHFDDAAGVYLAGQSDQKIGAELNLPWAMVAKIREAAYGPIKVDPELCGLRAEVLGLGTKIEALMKQQYGVVERLTAFEKKRGAGA